MKVVVGGDHAGYELKQKVLAYLEEQGHEVIHVGSYTPEMVDFPDIAAKVCRSILDGEAERGIMVCGTGVVRHSPATNTLASGRQSCTIFTLHISA